MPRLRTPQRDVPTLRRCRAGASPAIFFQTATGAVALQFISSRNNCSRPAQSGRRQKHTATERRGYIRAASLSQTEQCEHAAGFSFLGAIGIVKIGMTSCADAAVVDLFYALRATLLDDVCREIDFVMRRTNAGTELHDHVDGI